MAGYNPFRSFQKNQRFWLAVLGVGTMISFIILPVLMQLFTGGGGSGVEEFGRSRRFGAVNEQTIYVLSENRRSLEGFYEVLYRRLADPGDENRMSSLNYLASLASQYQQRANPEELVNNWLLAQYAKSQGLKIDQDDVVTFLSQLTAGYLSNQVFQEVLQAVNITEKRLEYLISLELLSSQMRQSFEISMGGVTPATRWDWFQRMNRQVTAEVVAVPVDRFLGEVPEPTDAQLRQIFEKYKDKPFNPTTTEGGFVVPNKVAFQYVLAAPSQKMLDSVTDEEISKYYEENKESKFLKPVRPVGDRPSLPGLPGQDPGSMFRPGLGGFTPTPGINRTTPFPMTRPMLPPTPAEAPATPDEEPPKTEEPKKEESKPEEPKPEEKAPEKAAENPESSSIVRNAVRTRFVSYQTETEAAPAAEAKAEEPKPELKSEAKAEEPKVEPESKTEELKKEEAVDLSILYRPLGEVKDEIRQTLAQEKAVEALTKIEEKMREYFQTYNLHIDMETEPPAMPDLSGTALDLGLELVTVKLDTFYGAAKSDFARGMQERERLAQLFLESQLPFQPENFHGNAGPYLYWVTEAVAEFKPEKMEDVKDLVVQRWKETQARPLAMKQAEQLAAEARESGKSLAETFAGKNDVSVVETEPFFWKSYGPGVSPWMAIMNRVPPRIGEVCEKGVAAGDSEIDNKWIFAPGNDFMEKAYSLGVGETGAVFNEPQTVAYVIRTTTSSPSEDVLWERFQLAHVMEYIYAGQPDIAQEAREAWMQRIYKEIGFEWFRDPNVFYGGR